jgi:hypothetical protein
LKKKTPADMYYKVILVQEMKPEPGVEITNSGIITSITASQHHSPLTSIVS